MKRGKKEKEKKKRNERDEASPGWLARALYKLCSRDVYFPRTTKNLRVEIRLIPLDRI
jgi:hypothetical protein